MAIQSTATMSTNCEGRNQDDNVFAVFYDMLKQIKEANRRNPCSKAVVRDGEQLEQFLAEIETPNIRFSGEERFGKYLDLHVFYNRYINSKFGDRTLTYINFLDRQFPVPVKTGKFKATGEYISYMKDVLEYLISFMERTQPLMFLDRIFSKLEHEFAEEWSRKTKKRPRHEIGADFDQYSTTSTTVEGLIEELGPVKIKEALDALGLKSGGTVRQRAERLLIAKDIPTNQLDRKHLKKERQDDEETSKEIALLEAKVKLCDILRDTIERTRQHVENKQAMILPDEDSDEDDKYDMGSDDEDGANNEIYNPLKLPMGWDDKPIPYWLYNLHGLGQEFDCEICGNQRYRGRRAFEMHFKESRHQRGLRCLGIPNTKSFNEITSIEDAKALWEEIQQRQGSTKWNPNEDEECEDSEGNIYARKTYNYLSKQGLV